MATTLQEAIDRSRNQDEIARATFRGDEADLLVAIDQLCDGEIDSARENDGTIGVWGDGWRINVSLSD